MLTNSSRSFACATSAWCFVRRVITSPLGLAVTYGVSATTSSVIAAYCEGRLTAVQSLNTRTGISTQIVPFIGNYSTLADFILLNPFVIYFLQRARLEQHQIDARLGGGSILPLYHRFGAAIVCIALGAFAMKLYVEGSPFFDATLIPDASAGSAVTVTGWIVYSWTAFYISWLLFSGLEHGAHVRRILILKPENIPYAPFHSDGAAGIRFLMAPTLSAGYALVGLLLTFLMFAIHDKVLYHINSNRLFGFILYVAVALPMFVLPFEKLHRLMKARRDDYLSISVEEALSGIRLASDRKDWEKFSGYMTAIENADKYRKIVRAFPIWPMPLVLALPSLGSVVGALIPIVQKIISGWLSVPVG